MTGVFFGLLSLLVVLNGVLGGVSYLVLVVIQSSAGEYFSYLGIVEYLTAWGGRVCC